MMRSRDEEEVVDGFSHETKAAQWGEGGSALAYNPTNNLPFELRSNFSHLSYYFSDS
jgi:hypothetical protein